MLPAFFILFMSAFEGGLVSTRHVMLERGVDLTVRKVRIGQMKEPTLVELKESVCEFAALIPECMDNLQVEMVVMDLRNWDDSKLAGATKCIDREEEVQAATEFQNGNNNQLMVLRVCSLFDPAFGSSGWGKLTLGGKLSDEGRKPYALVATSAFVMEPYQ